jgi:hypothetical protein
VIFSVAPELSQQTKGIIQAAGQIMYPSQSKSSEKIHKLDKSILSCKAFLKMAINYNLY